MSVARYFHCIAWYRKAFELPKLKSNEVIVRVMDPETAEKGTAGVSYSHIPHGKQNWRVQSSGL